MAAPRPTWISTRSIAARAVELVHATAEAIDIIDGYTAPSRAYAPWQPRAGATGWATEAPRGLLVDLVVVEEQAAIEADLTAFAPSVLALPHAEATLRLEQLIRSYDPCISCATHFLDLRIEPADR